MKTDSEVHSWKIRWLTAATCAFSLGLVFKVADMRNSPELSDFGQLAFIIGMLGLCLGQLIAWRRRLAG